MTVARRRAEPDHPEPDCPWCGSRDLVRLAEFGCNLLVQPHTCRSCGSPCEVIRKRTRPETPGGVGAS
jgi:rRNA maturation endonuclease Nob1